jgi:hypothetical protein
MASPDLGFDIIEPEVKENQQDAGYDVIEPENAQPTPSEQFEVIEPDKQYLSQIKRDYVSQGGNPLDVYAPERANLLTTEFNKNLESGLSQEEAMLKATDVLEALPPETRPDGSISAGYAPTEEAIQKGMIQPAALPAVRKAMNEGVLTVSSGFDKDKGVGFAVGKAKDGRVVRIEEKPPGIIGASLRSVGEQIIPGASAVAGSILGGVAGAPAGPVGILAGGLVGGAAGYKAGEMGQAGLARILAGEQGYADYQRMREADIAMFPITTKSLEIAAPIAVSAGLAGPTRAIDKFQQLLQPKAVPSLQAKPQPSEVIVPKAAVAATENVPTKTFYHGSPATSIENIKSDARGLVFVSESKDVSSSYRLSRTKDIDLGKAGLTNEERLSYDMYRKGLREDPTANPDQFLSSKEFDEASSALEKIEAYKKTLAEQGKIYEINIPTDKIIDWRNPDNFYKTLSSVEADLRTSGEVRLANILRNSISNKIPPQSGLLDKPVFDSLKKQGIEGITLPHSREGSETMLIRNALEVASEGQQPIRPGVVGEAGFESGTVRPEFKMPEVPEGSKIARTAERVLKSEKAPEPFKAEVALQPSTVRANVPLGAIKGNLEDLTDDELNVIARRSITSSAYDDAERAGANAILAARQIDADPASAAINWDEFTKAASLAGVSLRNVREYLSTPAGYLETISKAAEAAKRNIPKDVSDEVLRLFNVSKNAKAELVKAEANYRSSLTDRAAAIAENARRAAASATTKLQRYSDSIFPKKILGETLPQGIQITLLSPLSLVKNPVFNVARAVGQLGVRSLANAGDAVLSFVAKQRAVLGGKTQEEIARAGQRTMAQSSLTTRGAMIRGTEKTKEAIRAFLGEGIPESSALAGEGVKGFTVFKSLAQAFTGKDMVTNAKGNIALIDRVRKLTEGIIGLYTEPVGRALTLGDVPARGFAEGRLLAEQAILAGKSPREVLASVRFPTKTELKGISNKAAEATFQQDTKLTAVVGVVANAVKAVPIVGPLTKAVVAPYTKTPVNVVTDVVDVAVPGLAFSKSAYYAVKGDRKKSLEAAAKGIVGTVIGGTAAALYRAGVITGSASKSAKERGIQYETQPPNTINMSGLNRLLNGEDPAIQAGDDIKSYENFGYLGTIFNVYANVLSKNEGSGLLEDVLDVTLKGLPSVASYTLNQTFLKSTNTLLNAISKEDYDSYLESLYGTISSIPFPNTLQAFNKASRENMVDPKTDDSLQLFANVLKSKMPEFAREAIGAEELPLKRDMWGNPVKQTPEGANPFLYNFLDFTRSRIVPSDESNLALYRLWKETGNADALPSVPEGNVMDKKITYQLDESQYAIYQEYVGQRRKALVDNLFQSATFDGMDADFKIKALGKAYERGAEDGKRQFLKYNRDYLTPKEK